MIEIDIIVCVNGIIILCNHLKHTRFLPFVSNEDNINYNDIRKIQIALNSTGVYIFDGSIGDKFIAFDIPEKLPENGKFFLKKRQFLRSFIENNDYIEIKCNSYHIFETTITDYLYTPEPIRNLETTRPSLYECIQAARIHVNDSKTYSNSTNTCRFQKPVYIPTSSNRASLIEVIKAADNLDEEFVNLIFDEIREDPFTPFVRYAVEAESLRINRALEHET